MAWRIVGDRHYAKRNEAPNAAVLASNMPKEMRERIRGLQIDNEEGMTIVTLEEHVGSDPIHLFVMTKEHCRRIADVRPGVICTPMRFATQLRHAPPAATPPVPADIADGDDAMSDEDEEDNQLAQYPMSVLLKAIELCMDLKSPEKMERTVRLASFFALSPEAHAEFCHKIKTKEIRIPNRQTLYRAMVKIDYASCWWERYLFHSLKDHVCEQLTQYGADSSPQRAFDYMTPIEMRYKFIGCLIAIARTVHEHGLLAAFTYVRRTMITQCIGLADKGEAQKLSRVLTSIMYETEDDDFDRRRLSVIGWQADQGDDIQIGDAPNCEAGNMHELVRGLHRGHIDFRTEAARNGYLFPLGATVPEFLHAVFGALKDALQGTDAFKAFEPVLKEIITTVGSKPWRSRMLALCMVNAAKHERRTMHAFPRRKFDWRWETLECLLEALSEMWPAMKAYYQKEAMMKESSLHDIKQEHLARALENDPSDLPDVELMINQTSVICQAQGHNGRWLKGCDCHGDILVQRLSRVRRAELLAESGLTTSSCPLMGLRLTHLIHGGLQAMKDNVKNAASPRLQELMTSSREESRVKMLEFCSQATNSIVDQMGDKFDFVLKPPHLIAGLFGVFFGYSIAACVDIGHQLVAFWAADANKSGVHRILVYLFTTEVLLQELHAFCSFNNGPQPRLDQLPNLFFFTLRLVLLSCVGHYLEGRHRYVALQIAGAGAATKPGNASFRMRTQEHAANLVCNRFLLFISGKWREKSVLTDLLNVRFDVAEYRRQSYSHKVAMFYSYDPKSLHPPVAHRDSVLKLWKAAHRARTKAQATPQGRFEHLAIDYVKSRFEVGACFLLPKAVANLGNCIEDVGGCS
jgi:hypothetical protein